MDHDSRLFQPITVNLVGVEYGEDRFNSHGEHQFPTVSKWRNNLTALSQRYNLYFITSDSEIVVYEPEFPFQSLGSKHALCIKPGLANSAAPGYLNNRHDRISKHCINHLTLGDLGTQEILLVSTDSGNIVAYYIHAIWEAIQKDPYRFSEKAYAEMVGLRPFFSQWVYQSAWGLSIHKEARMIAVSANVPNEAQPATRNELSATVTVYAFALHEKQHEGTEIEGSDEESNGDTDFSQDLDWNDWIPLKDGSPPTRDRNHKILLAGFDGHENNIPNISFINSSEDEEGAWLLSTDISGATKLWQVWKQKCWKTWDFGNHDNPNAFWLNQSYPGWNVVAFDLRSFRPARTTDELIGYRRAPMYYGYNDRGDSYNLTAIVRERIPDSSDLHPLHPQVLQEDDEVSEPEELYTYLSETDDEVMSDADIGYSEAESNSDGAGLNASDQQDSDEYSSQQSETNSRTSTIQLAESHEIANAVMSNMGTAYGSTRGTPKSEETRVPNVAIMHCGDSHIRLLSGPRAKFPHVYCGYILKQNLPGDIHRSPAGAEFSHMDRLNMMQMIPELGLVLVASQTGRVCVCSLTRRADGFLGLRVDWKLPTKKQERNGSRPDLCVLIGIAVGPIQGHLDPDPQSSSDEDNMSWGEDCVVDGVPTTFDDRMVKLKATENISTPQNQSSAIKARSSSPQDIPTQQAPWKAPASTSSWAALENSRRYRLMLTYSDLSVLTYELSRDVERGDIAGSDEE